MQNNIKNIQDLKKKIAVYRNKLQDIWNIHGSTNADVLAVSVELDNLLNIYQKYQLSEEFPTLLKSEKSINGRYLK